MLLMLRAALMDAMWCMCPCIARGSFFLVNIQVKCEVVVKKVYRMRATRDMERCLSDFTAYDFARASAEV